MGLIGKLFCALIIVIGISEVVGHTPTAFKGVQLTRSDDTAEARITAKQIERPGPTRKARVESVSINGEKVRGFRTYFNQYVLTVALAGPEGETTVAAPVSYDRWHQEQIGNTVAVRVTPKVAAFADADDNATLYYALHKMAFGFLMIGVGFVAMRLPDSDNS